MRVKITALLPRARRYLTDGRNLRRIRASGLFDEAWYLAKNPEVAQAKVDPLLHYLRNGGFEGRDPGPNFWSAWYLETYEDVRKAGINPLVHYLEYGKEERRYPKRPDVTVIIPVFNKSRYLAACLKSVLSQTGITLEVICVDDCSSDGSWEIAEEVAKGEPRLRLVRNEANRGAFHSRNLGISLARGRYLQFSDADDLLPPGSLAVLLEATERTGSEVTRGNLQPLPGRVVAPWASALIKEEKSGTLLDLPELWIPWWHVCFLISRELLAREKIQYPALVAGEDPVFLAAVLTKANRICVTPRPTYAVRPNDLRSRPKLRTVHDYIAHAQLVKTIYAGQYERCWATYQPFIIEEIRLLLSQAQVTFDEYQALEDQVLELA